MTCHALHESRPRRQQEQSQGHHFVRNYGLGPYSDHVVLFLMREKGMALKQIAIYYALVVLIGAGGAMFVSGRVIVRLTRISKEHTRRYGLLRSLSPSLSLSRLFGNASGILACFFLVGTLFLSSFYLSSMVTLVHQEVRPDQSVMSGGLPLRVMDFIGPRLGPTYIGAASDCFHATDSNHSLQIAGLQRFYVMAILLFLWLALALFNESRTVGVRVQ